MTTTKIIGLLGLLLGLALVRTMAAGTGYGRPPEHNLDALTVSDGKGPFGFVVRDGDRFVALRILKGDNKLGYLHNFKKNPDTLEVDDQYLGYDLCGKNKNVLVREQSGKDIKWEFVPSEKEEPFKGRFRVKNGELKGWWIGLGPLEPAKEGQRPRAPLVLVKDKKDAAGFRWTNPEDE